MIEYRFMDESFIVPCCLHGGSIDLSDLKKISENTQTEKQFNLAPGSIYTFLKEVCKRYGTAGIAAVDYNDGRIVGMCRFYPVYIFDLLKSSLCLQDEKSARILSEFNKNSLIPLNELNPKSLQIDCFQIISEYRGKGIAKAFLSSIISWAKENKWTEIYCEALQDIYPILAWSGHLSDKMLGSYGFEIIERFIDVGIKEAAGHMRLGYHGQSVKKEWDEKYGYIPDDYEYYRFRMKLSL